MGGLWVACWHECCLGGESVAGSPRSASALEWRPQTSQQQTF